MKKLLTLTLFTCLVLSGCNSQPKSESELLTDIPKDTQESVQVEKQNTTKNLETKTTPTPKPKTTQTKQAETNTITYYNETYDFSLLLEKEWKDYRTEEVKRTNYGIYHIDFYLPGYDYSFFAISIFTPEQWSEILKEDGPKPQMLGQKNGNVFTYSQGQDYPESLTTQFAQISKIITTFR